MRFSNKYIAQNVEIGVLNQLYAATDGNAEAGQFIGPDGRGEAWGYPTIVQPVAAAKDPDAARTSLAPLRRTYRSTFKLHE